MKDSSSSAFKYLSHKTAYIHHPTQACKVKQATSSSSTGYYTLASKAFLRKPKTPRITLTCSGWPEGRCPRPVTAGLRYAVCSRAWYSTPSCTWEKKALCVTKQSTAAGVAHLSNEVRMMAHDLIG